MTHQWRLLRQKLLKTVMQNDSMGRICLSVESPLCFPRESTEIVSDKILATGGLAGV